MNGYNNNKGNSKELSDNEEQFLLSELEKSHSLRFAANKLQQPASLELESVVENRLPVPTAVSTIGIGQGMASPLNTAANSGIQSSGFTSQVDRWSYFQGLNAAAPRNQPSPATSRPDDYARLSGLVPTPPGQAAPLWAGTLAFLADRHDSTSGLNQAQQGPNSPLRPTRTPHPQTYPKLGTPQRVAEAMLSGFSPNYKGDRSNPINQSAKIPDEENCALWLTNLPPDITTHTLLGAIRSAGRVFATHINRPNPARGHSGAAVKVVFFDRAGAERFWDACQRQGGFSVMGVPAASKNGGCFGYDHPDITVQPLQQRLQQQQRPQFRHQEMTQQDQHGQGQGQPAPPPRCDWGQARSLAKVFWNRTKVAAQDVGGHKSRVIMVTGPPQLVQPATLLRFFATRFDFQIDEVVRHYYQPLPASEGTSVGGAAAAAEEEKIAVEIRFGSYRSQAATAYAIVKHEMAPLGVQCRFVEDPCDIASNFDVFT